MSSISIRLIIDRCRAPLVGVACIVVSPTRSSHSGSGDRRLRASEGSVQRTPCGYWTPPRPLWSTRKVPAEARFRRFGERRIGSCVERLLQLQLQLHNMREIGDQVEQPEGLVICATGPLLQERGGRRNRGVLDSELMPKTSEAVVFAAQAHRRRRIWQLNFRGDCGIEHSLHSTDGCFGRMPS
jgi:hypothetical protein